jgi:ribosomal protein S18 acetylase RimI-like enzyme
MVSELHVRQAHEEDVPALVALHVRAWQWAYRDQIPDRYLDGLSQTIAQREEWRRTTLRQAPGEQRTWVAALSGSVVGFADTGPSRDDDAGQITAELYSIHVDPVWVRRGVGRALMAYAMEDLRRRGYRLATLWVLETNGRARRFYEAAGWSPDGATKIDTRRGFDLHELRYTIELTAGSAI